jgi:hypothetical protein
MLCTVITLCWSGLVVFAFVHFLVYRVNSQQSTSISQSSDKLQPIHIVFSIIIASHHHIITPPHQQCAVVSCSCCLLFYFQGCLHPSVQVNPHQILSSIVTISHHTTHYRMMHHCLCCYCACPVLSCCSCSCSCSVDFLFIFQSSSCQTPSVESSSKYSSTHNIPPITPVRLVARALCPCLVSLSRFQCYRMSSSSLWKDMQVSSICYHISHITSHHITCVHLQCCYCACGRVLVSRVVCLFLFIFSSLHSQHQRTSSSENKHHPQYSSISSYYTTAPYVHCASMCRLVVSCCFVLYFVFGQYLCVKSLSSLLINMDWKPDQENISSYLTSPQLYHIISPLTHWPWKPALSCLVLSCRVPPIFYCPVSSHPIVTLQVVNQRLTHSNKSIQYFAQHPS